MLLYFIESLNIHCTQSNTFCYSGAVFVYKTTLLPLDAIIFRRLHRTSTGALASAAALTAAQRGCVGTRVAAVS